MSDNDFDSVEANVLDVLHLELAKLLVSPYEAHGIGVEAFWNSLNQHFVCLMGESPAYAYTFVIVRVRLDEATDWLTPDRFGNDGLAVIIKLPVGSVHPVCQCPVGTHG